MADRIVMARTGLADLMALLREERGLPSPFSPLSHPRLAERLALGQPAGRPMPSDPASMALFKESLPALASPGMKFILRTGGGSSPMAEEIVCLAENEKPAGLLVEGADVLVVLYANAGAVADGFLGLHASRTQGVSPNLIPPLTNIGGFLCLLHAIDMYRRSYYASMLSCQPQTEPGVAAEVFLKDMSRVLETRDVRWLLGAFIALMPNLQIDRENPDPVGVLIEAGLCRMMKDKSGKPWLQFTDAGKALGVEFERTWLTCAGYSVAGIAGNREFMVGSGFIAPTAVTNHVMTLAMENGNPRINHQSFYTDQVKAMWMDLFDAGWKLVQSGGPPPVAVPVVSEEKPAQSSLPPSAQPAPGSRFCEFCGKQLPASHRFCDSCGKPIA